MSDYLIVNRNNTNYQLGTDEMSKLRDTDLLLVNRDGVTYTMPGSELATGDLQLVTISPLTIDPPNTLTATTDLNGIAGGSTINFKWYRYDAYNTSDGKTLVKDFNSNSAISNSYTTTPADQGKFIGCTVTYLDVSVSESARSEVSTSPLPLADMHGLRFDNSRVTGLVGPYSVSSAGSPDTSAWTFSAWAKPSDTDNGFILSLPTAGNEVGFRVYQGSWAWFGPNLSFAFTTAQVNEWAHVLIQNKNGAVKFYLNGTQVGGENSIDATVVNGELKIGYRKDGTGDNNFDGYLSDVYFADGRALEPTAFGKEFLQGWGPLDSSVIKESIGDGPVEPYATRANTDEVWSAAYYDSTNSLITSSEKLKAFDGDITTGANISGSAGQSEQKLVTTAFPAGSGPYTVEGMCLNPSTDGGLCVNDDYSNNVPSGGSGVWVTIGTFDEVTSIHSFRGREGYPDGGVNHAAWRVNGRILVDSNQWNNSQNWSYGCNWPAVEDGTPHGAFDGKTYGTYALSTRSDQRIFINAPELAGQLVEFYGNDADSRGRNVIMTTSEGSTTTGQAVSPEWRSIGSLDSNGQGTITTNASASFYVAINALRVGGVMLVDSGAQYNTSEAWSDTVPFIQTGNGGVANKYKAFDGDITQRSYTTGSDPAAKSLVVDLTGKGLSGDVRIFTYCGRTSGEAPATLQLNGGTSVNTSDYYTTALYDWIPLGSANPVETITITVNNGSDNAYIGAIEVDGKLLVDQANFGINGFYLPFDPSAAGADYSGQATGTLTGGSGTLSALSNAFDGLITTRFAANQDNTNLEITFDSVVSVTDTLKIYVGSDTRTFLKDATDSTFTQLDRDGSDGYVVFNGPFDLKSIENSAKLNSSRGAIYLIEVDGKVLVDHSSIGVDDSGNGNTFHDQNFNVLPYVPGNNVQDWVGEGTWSWVKSGAPQGDSGIFNKELLFSDLVLNKGADAGNGNPGYIRYTFNSPLYYNDTIELYASIDTDSNASRDVRFKAAGTNEQSLTTVEGEYPPGKWFNITPYMNTAPLEYIEWGNYGGSDPNRSPNGLYAIRVDGKILTQTGTELIPPIDQVTDTPLKDFATYITGSNGNLETTAASYANQDAAGKVIYFESMCTSGSTNSNGYLNSNHIRVYDSTDANALVRGDGYTSNTTLIKGDPLYYGLGDVVGTVYDSINERFTFYVNGAFRAQYNIDASIFGADDRFVTMNGSGTNSVINFGQQTLSHAIDNGNGTVTLDLPSNISPYDSRANTDEVWSGMLSSTGSSVTNPTRGFDGNTSTAAEGAGGPLTFTPTTPIPFNKTIEIFPPADVAGYNISVNGGDNVFVTPTNGYSVVAQGPGTLTSITSTRYTNVAFDGGFAAIKVDGRLLVDNGVWNVSQNWSGDTSKFTTTQSFYPNNQYPPSLAFDGDLTTSFYAVGQGSDITWDLSSFNLSGTVRVRPSATTNSDDYSASMDGAPFTMVSDPWSQPLTSVGNIGSITVSGISGISDGALTAIEVNGAILVDAGAQWNTSQVWSETGTLVGPSDNVYKAFDGDMNTTFTNSDNQTSDAATYTFNPPITGASSIRIYGYSDNSGVPLLVNGAPISATPSKAWYDISGGVLESFSVNHLSGTGQSGVSLVEVDGKLLVDAQNVGPFNQLFQTWEESKLTTLKADVAASVYLVETLRAHAEPFDATESYCEGRIVTALGSLWMATEDCEALRQAPASTYGVGNPVPWVNLGVSAT